MSDVALDYHSPHREEGIARGGGWRFALGALCGICSSCAGMFAAFSLLFRIWPTSNAPDKYILPCFMIAGIAGFAGLLIVSHFRYCRCGLLAAAGAVFGVMALISWMLAGWHG